MKTISAMLAVTTVIGFPHQAASAPVQCPEGRGIYQGVSAPTHELIFSSDQKGTLKLAKGKLRANFPFAVTSSNGFSRVYINIAGKDAPSSVVMNFNPDFTAYRGEGSAPYLVTPELPVGFYYWDLFRFKENMMELLPGDAWHLVRCSSAP